MKKTSLFLRLICTCIGIMFITSTYAQLEVSIGAGRTDLHKSALTVGVSYLKSFDSLFGGKTSFISKKNSFLVITPQMDLDMGTEDAFSSLNIKAAGLLCTFRNTTVAGLETPDFNRTFHIFPFTAGIETNSTFTNVNAVFEAGWIPYYQSYGRGGPDWIKKTNIGLFLQAGYKLQKGGATGGLADESQEAPNKTILRLKGNAGIDTKQLVKINGLSIGVVGQADVWYDAINNAFYDKVEARGRFYINADQYIDFIYAHGSGAPLFNSGDQLGLGVTVKFK